MIVRVKFITDPEESEGFVLLSLTVTPVPVAAAPMFTVPVNPETLLSATVTFWEKLRISETAFALLVIEKLGATSTIVWDDFVVALVESVTVRVVV